MPESMLSASQGLAPGSARAPGDRRVLVASHSHPIVSKGGAEIAAFEMFRGLQATEGFSASFLGCSRSNAYRRLGQGITQPFSEDEYIYSTSSFDWFKFANLDPKFPREFKALLRDLRPDVVHFHHYINFGLEALLYVKEALPDAKVLLTLHEYLLICNHLGQMIKTEKGMLCNKSGLVDCATCFPHLQPADFMLRNMYAQRFLEAVDHYISPSHFLAERYISWGVPREKMSVLENVIRPHATVGGAAASDAALAETKSTAVRRTPNRVIRLGFFGQISKLKGINVIFDAAKLLERDGIMNVLFEIHGDYRSQPADFQADFLLRLEQVGDNVRYHGPYQNEAVDKLMQSVDIVLVASTWWENSPVVIQEALRNKRPIICSDIGGMAEKVRDEIDGLHFPANSPLGLANVIRDLAKRPGRLGQLVETMAEPISADEVIARHADLYRVLQSAPASQAPEQRISP